MSSIHQIYTQVKAGRSLEAVIEETYPGADPRFWRTIIANYNPDKAPAKRRPARRRAGSRSRKVNHAARVVARSMATLVERVNSEDEPKIFSAQKMAVIDAKWRMDHPADDCGMDAPLLPIDQLRLGGAK